MLVWSFETPSGTVEIIAEVVIEGSCLHLKDIAIYPRGAVKLSVGVREVLSARGRLAREARALGFRQLRVTGRRLSGANPGRLVDFTIDLGE
jgi:hypothetical protein